MLHILIRYIAQEKNAKVNPDNLRNIHLPKFLHSHEECCKTISQKYLEVKCKNWDQFKEDLFFEAYALNLVGIMIWARAYHKHVYVFFGYNYWANSL